jgi:hypothetical protein
LWLNIPTGLRRLVAIFSRPANCPSRVSGVVAQHSHWLKEICGLIFPPG